MGTCQRWNSTCHEIINIEEVSYSFAARVCLDAYGPTCEYFRQDDGSYDGDLTWSAVLTALGEAVGKNYCSYSR